MEKKDYKVYKYTSPSGGVYIGQTHKSIDERAGRNGYYYLVLNKKTGEFLQPSIGRAIMKYGWDNFKKEILYDNLSSEEADILEKQLITEYKNKGECYNCNEGGKCITHNKTRKIKQYTLRGEFIKTWDSIIDAEHFLNIKRSQANIIACCQGKKKRAYGYIWRYEEDTEDIIPLRPYRSSVCQFTKDGEYVATYSTIKEASKSTRVNENGIGNVLHNRAETCGGYKWKFLDECKDDLFNIDNNTF